MIGLPEPFVADGKGVESVAVDIRCEQCLPGGAAQDLSRRDTAQ